MQEININIDPQFIPLIEMSFRALNSFFLLFFGSVIAGLVIWRLFE